MQDRYIRPSQIDLEGERAYAAWTANVLLIPGTLSIVGPTAYHYSFMCHSSSWVVRGREIDEADVYIYQ